MQTNASRILVIGHWGMLGSDLMDHLGDRAVGVDRDQCDITRHGQIAAVLDESRPDAIVVDAAKSHGSANVWNFIFFVSS